jgi:hypothetical protein
MIGSSVAKYLIVMMVVLLVMRSHSTVEAVRRDEIKALLDGAKFAETILRANMDPCTSCTIGCSHSCKSCTTCIATV